VRDPREPAQWRYVSGFPDVAQQPGDEDAKITFIFLTVHHIGVEQPDGSPGDMHDKMDCRPENLIALCQRCHLLADLSDHVEKAKRTRINKNVKRQREAGQQEMF